VNVHINAHDSFDTTITNSFNTAINNIIVNQFFILGGSQAQLQQALAASLVLAAQQDFQGLLALATDEVELAGDTVFALSGGMQGMNNAGLTGLMHAIQQDIQHNPLEGTLAGQVAGSLVFNTVINQTVNVNASGGSSVTVIA
jgi:hypothetical protein